MDFDHEIAERLCTFMDEHGKKQKDLAEMLKVDPNTVSNWANGAPIPDFRFLGVCEALRINPRWLLLGEGFPEIPQECIAEGMADYGKKVQGTKKIREAILRDEIKRLRQELELPRPPASAD